MAIRQIHLSHWNELRFDRPRYRLYRFRCDRREDMGQDRFTVEKEEFHNVRQLTERQIMTELIKYNRDELKRISAVAAGCNPTALSKMEPFEQSLALAASMRELDAMITPQMMSDVVVLMNSPLGFLTDRVPPKDKPYETEIVKQCFIEATLRGARTVGNEWNIISNKAYLTRAYFERALKELPGLKKLIITPGVPFMKEGGAIVKMKATWTYEGHLGSMERDIPVRVNNGMGTDAILGKADRKFRAAILRQLTGTDWGEEEEELQPQSIAGVTETTAVKADVKPPETTPQPKAEPQKSASQPPAMSYDQIEAAIASSKSIKELEQLMDEISISMSAGDITQDGANKLGHSVKSAIAQIKKRQAR